MLLEQRDAPPRAAQNDRRDAPGRAGADDRGGGHHDILDCSPMHRRFFFLLVIFAIGCQQHQTVVVWISIDGFRGDYVDPVETPTFQRLMREGVYSHELTPITPSITFP